jgi:hypothetical protein
MRDIASVLETTAADFQRAGEALPDRRWEGSAGVGVPRRPVLIVALAAAVVLLLAVPAAFFGGGGQARDPVSTGDLTGVPVSATNAAVPTTATQPLEYPPYLLLEADAWHMVSYYQGPGPRNLRDSLYDGPDGAHVEVQIWSGSAADIERQVQDRVEEANSKRPVTIAGIDAVAGDYSGDIGFRTIVVGGADAYVIEIDYQSSAGGSNADLDTLLAGIRFVGRVDFEQAVPAGSVTSATRESVVAEMLADIPLPPGFDVSKITATGDRYYVGADVTSAVTCGWIEAWTEAKKNADSVTEAAAVDAMQSSRNWAILLEMDAEGDYPKVIWSYADGMAGDGTLPGSAGLAVEDAAHLGIGCE